MAPKCSLISLTALAIALSLTLSNAFAANKKHKKKQQAGTAAPVEASAEPADPKVTQKFQHTLKGHDFMPSFLIPAPFADSEAQLSMGFGWASQQSPTLLSGLQNLSLVSFTPVIAGQVKVGKSFAVTFGFSGTVITGINTSSIINYGATVQYSYLLGGLYEIIRKDDTVFSGALQLQYPHTLAVSPAGLIPQAIQGLLGAASADFQSSSVQEVWSPTLRVAHAFSPEFGLKADFGGSFTSYSDEDTSDARAQALFGLGLEYDLKPLLNVALGLTFSYNRNQVVIAGASNSDRLELGLYETFRHAFNAGVELGKIYSNGYSSTVGALVLRTYYN